jgi:3-hydroxyacyl-CoA dehydrogenase
MFELGVDAKEMDDALVAWGMPMGPLRLIDEIGVDITVDIADTLEKAFGRRNQRRSSAALAARWEDARTQDRQRVLFVRREIANV